LWIAQVSFSINNRFSIIQLLPFLPKYSMSNQTGKNAENITEVAPKIFRVVVPLPIPDVKSMNSYVIFDAGRNLIADPGMAYPAGIKEMERAIGYLGLAILFIKWSAGESGYGKDPRNIAQNNYFGIQNPSNAAGRLGGKTIACNRNGSPIPVNSKNACFASTVTWQQELEISLSIDPLNKPNSVTYRSALETALINGASMGAAMQAIASNGWNSVNPNYGNHIANDIKIDAVVDCLTTNGLIQ
jgi:hypothetical protein